MQNSMNPVPMPAGCPAILPLSVGHVSSSADHVQQQAVSWLMLQQATASEVCFSL
jgi:hypothetical protein